MQDSFLYFSITNSQCNSNFTILSASLLLREANKMNEVIQALGVLYDDLAKLQADAKIQKFSDAHPALMVHVILNISSGISGPD